jgi:hypothetical protein
MVGLVCQYRNFWCLAPKVVCELTKLGRVGGRSCYHYNSSLQTALGGVAVFKRKIYWHRKQKKSTKKFKFIFVFFVQMTKKPL